MRNMVKNKKTINKGEKDNENVEVVDTISSELSLTPAPEATERIIYITVDSIENIVKRDTVVVTISVYHNDLLLGESQPLRIEPDFQEPPSKYPIDFQTQLPIIFNSGSNIGAVVSTPLLIKVSERQESDEKFLHMSSAAGDSKKKEKTKGSGKSTESKETKILGFCNLDILQLLLGDKILTERLIVEEENQSSTIRGSSWMNLPILTVTLTHDQIDFFPSDLQVNYISITVESIYNPPISFAESLEYKAATIVHIDGEEPETVLFEHGKFSKYRDVEKTKRWKSLNGKCEGRAALSKYKIDFDYENTKNQLETNIDLKKILEEDKPRIQWNSLSRQLLLSSGQQAMNDRINKYKYWPFQFMISSNVSEGGKSKSKDLRPQLYQCYADVSELLYPGKTQTRIITQLHSYNQSKLMETTGLQKSLFNIAVTSEIKPKEKKGKLSTKGGSATNVASMEPEVESSYPINNEKGEPVFVILQLELKNPLIASRTTEELTQELHELLGPPDKLPPYAYTGDLAEEQYLHCIRKLVETITESYRDFTEMNNNTSDPRPGCSSTCPGQYSYIPDEVDRFIQFLYDTGNYVAIQATLKNKIILLLDQKFRMKSYTLDSEECQNLVATAYLYLVEQMHVALNSPSENQLDDEITDIENLCYYAEENYELGNVDQAKNHYINLVTTNRKNPESWLKFAIFLKKYGDEERALECCRKAIHLDSRNKIALLMHGIILTEKEQFQDAEIFLKSTTELYPLFAEGWAVLHLFYHRIEYFQGVDLTIRVAEKCLKDQDRDKISINLFEKEPLAWSTIHCPKDRVYLIIAVFLLKLNLFDFAGIALAKELSLTGRSTAWLYFMAVHHYLLRRYDDALTHLKEAEQLHGMDYSISGLMGHCYAQKGNTESAIECYEFASTLFNRPADIHLIDVRLGNYYLDAEKYDRAKKKFLGKCKTTPTAFSWLGLGIACYHMQDLKDAETALMEANRLDHKNPEIWAYLCLLNMNLQRYEEFAECYRQMVKNDLENAKVWLLITNTMESLELSSPMLLSATSRNTIIKESSGESNVEIKDT